MDGLIAAADSGTLLRRFRRVRADTEARSAHLGPEDQCIQSMPDASPAKWHRAHTTWFFEQFVLEPHCPGYRRFDERFGFLFNSYYDSVGARHPRPARGLLTRPTAEEVTAYRTHVDTDVARLLAQDMSPEVERLVELGMEHEQQHAELLMTDILHAFAQSPLAPAAIPGWRDPTFSRASPHWLRFDAGLHGIGHDGRSGFHFDNETPRHTVFLPAFGIAATLVRNGDYARFVAERGYERPSLWMADGFECARRNGWNAPLHWRREGGGWTEFTPRGLAPLDPNAPVRHVSWYEADAFARWAGARLPTEAELEVAAPAGLLDYTGQVWQWTASAYRPYPGYRAAEGALGEYNGKFMINTMVLRGGSAATPTGHARPTYRNYFAPDKRWQYSGIRLAAAG